MASEWTPERHAAARARCEEVAGESWECEGATVYDPINQEVAVCLLADDALWIAAAKLDLPDALAEIERLTARLTLTARVVEIGRRMVNTNGADHIAAGTDMLDALAALDAYDKEHGS